MLINDIYHSFHISNKKNPLLFIGLIFILCLFIKFTQNAFLTVFLPLIIFPFCNKKNIKTNLLITFFIFTGTFFYPDLFYQLPDIKKPTYGKGIFQIESIKPTSISFKKGLIYKGSLKTFSFGKSNEKYKNIPCSILLFSEIKNRPLANHSYYVEGILIEKSNFHFLLKTKKDFFWKRANKAHNLAETRYFLKSKIKKFINSKFSRKETKSFFCGIITGEFNDKFLAFSFSKCGLQHIMAISGFHFGIIVLFFSVLLNLIFPKKTALLLLLVVVNLYFLFIGKSPSIQRVWITVQIFLLAKLLNKKSFSLNALIISLMVQLLFNPLNLLNIAFQLSFLCAFALVCLYIPIENQISKILLRRTDKELKELNKASNIIHKISSFLRQVISITIAINICIFPLLLFYFKKFSLLSLLYNLFFPFAVSFSIILLLISFIIYLICPYIANILFVINDAYTSFLLDMTAYAPPILEHYIQMQKLPVFFVIIYIYIIMFLSIYFRFKINKKDNNELLNMF
jgi:competence protein ComEC